MRSPSFEIAFPGSQMRSLAHAIGTWQDVLRFYFAPVDDGFSSEDLEKIEEQINTALMPSCSLGDLEADTKRKKSVPLMAEKKKSDLIVLPALRGIMGDWIHYTCLMDIGELSKRVRYTKEVHKNKLLSDMIQRRLRSGRAAQIAQYLENQPER